MKKTFLITIGLLILCIKTYAQEVVSDTTYLTQINGLFFEISRFDYKDGGYNQIAKLIGNTNDLLVYHQGLFYQQSLTFRNNAIQLANADRAFIRMIRYDDFLQSNYGISPILRIQTLNDTTFVNDTWQYEDENGVRFPITFSRNVSGKLRVTFNSNTTTVHLFGQAMRIINFPSTTPTNFYQIEDGVWIDASRRRRLVRVSISSK